MKWIKYLYNGAEVSMGWNAENEEIAKAEADNGEYTIEDDGQPVPGNISADELLNVMLGVTE